MTTSTSRQPAIERCTGPECAHTSLDGMHWHGPPDLAALVGPLDQLGTYFRNPRRGDVEVIASSLAQHGQYRAIAVNLGTHTGRPHEVLAGNHTLKAAASLGWTGIARTFVDVDDDTAQRIVLADNGTADVGTYDTSSLLDLLQQQSDNLDGLGYSEDDIERLEAMLAAETEGEGEDDSTADRALTTGEALTLVDVAMGEPKHTVRHGECWKVGRHLLVCAKVRDEHHLWAKYLDEGVHLCPYPEPYLTLSGLAKDAMLLLVQPSPYLAGHLLDKHASVHGEQSVRQVNE